MFKNLQIEWMKIKNYRVFQVFSILYMLGILLIIFIFYKIYTSITGKITGTDDADLFSLFTESNLWNSTCFATSFLLYLPGMVIINLFINEVNFKTHRQNIIDGWKRETFIITKIGLIVCMSAVITVMNFIAGLIMANITNTSISFQVALPVMGFCFIQSFVYLLFALFLATLFRRSGVAIIVFFLYGLILEWILVWMLYKIVPGFQFFLPLQVADSLILLPGMDGIFLSMPNQLVMVAAALAFAGLYIYLTVRKYKYDDL